MLYIKEEGQDAMLPWHVGEPLPHLSRRVITFQADGEELELILDAMTMRKTVARTAAKTSLQHAYLLAEVRRLLDELAHECEAHNASGYRDGIRYERARIRRELLEADWPILGRQRRILDVIVPEE